MALYVWYDGQNLMENFGIRKGVIKTDTDDDLEEVDIEDSLEKKEKVDFNNSVLESNEEIAKELEWIEQDMAKFQTSSDMETKQYMQRIQLRNTIMNSDPSLKEKNNVENPDNLNTVILSYNSGSSSNVYAPMTQLPQNVFNLMDNDTDDLYGDDEDSTPLEYDRNHYLQGNLSSFYDFL